MKFIILVLSSFFYTMTTQAQSMTAIDSLQVNSADIIFDKIITQTGGDSIGSGDLIDLTKHTAWFYGAAPIETCYHITSNFGVDSATINASFHEAVSTWNNYIATKKMGANVTPENRINTNFLLKSSCTGGEDLVLYFGTGPIFSNLRDLRARQLRHQPAAYVNKTHISNDLKWSKGYILFSEPEAYRFNDSSYFPQWTKGEALSNFLLHEIGHVLGFTHTPGTIMTSNIVLKNFLGGEAYKQKSAVDQEQELHNCSTCQKSYTSISGTALNPISNFKITTAGHATIQAGDGTLDIEITGVSEKTIDGNLLTFFDLESYKQKVPSIYYIKFQGTFYSLELEGNNALLKLNGKLISTYIRSDIAVGDQANPESRKTSTPKTLYINLLQEKKEIFCTNGHEKSVLIDKKDRFFKLSTTQSDLMDLKVTTTKYSLTEFLDKAILAESKNTQKSALIQLLPKNKASFINGELISFTEGDCKQVNAHKVCTKGNHVLTWSPTKLALNKKTYTVKHYGAYPNDGTYFMAYNNNQGLAIVDYGSKFVVLQGGHSTLSCRYQ